MIERNLLGDRLPFDVLNGMGLHIRLDYINDTKQKRYI